MPPLAAVPLGVPLPSCGVTPLPVWVGGPGFVSPVWPRTMDAGGWLLAAGAVVVLPISVGGPESSLHALATNTNVAQTRPAHIDRIVVAIVSQYPRA